MKKTLLILGSLILLLVFGLAILLLIVTSNAFVRAVVLPRVSEATGIPIAAQKVAFSPSRSLELRDLTVGEQDDPLLRAGTVRVRYKFMPLLRKQLEVNEVLLADVSVHVTDAKVAALTARAQPSPPMEERADAPRHTLAAEAAAAPVVTIRNISVKNLSAVYVKQMEDGKAEESYGVHGLSATIAELANSKPFRVEVSAALSAAHPNFDVKVGNARVVINGTLDAALLPEALLAEAAATELAGQAGEVDLANRSVEFRAEVLRQNATYNVAELSVWESLSGQEEGRLTVQGTVAPAPLELDLELHASMPGGAVLNLVGGMLGDYDFGNTAVSFGGRTTVRQGGEVLTAQGDLRIERFTLASRQLGVEPLDPIDIRCEFQAGFDRRQDRAELRKLSVDARTAVAQVASVRLEQPTHVLLGSDGMIREASPTTLIIETNALDLGLLKPLIPKSEQFTLHGGRFSDRISIEIADAGKRIDAEVTVEVSGLSLDAADLRFRDLEIRQSATVSLRDFKQLTIKHFNLQFAEGSDRLQSGEAITLACTGDITLQPLAGELALQLQPVTGTALGLIKHFMPDLELHETALAYTGTVRLTDDGGGVQAAGTLTVRNGQASSNQRGIRAIDPVNITAEHDLSMHLESKRLHVARANVMLGDAQRDVVTIVVAPETAIHLDALDQGPPIHISLRAEDLHLEPYLPLVPPEAGLTELKGVLGADIALEVAPSGKTVRGRVRTEVIGLQFTMDQVGRLRPLDVVVYLEPDLCAEQMLRIEKAGIRAAEGPDTLLDLAIEGHVDIALSGQRSEVRITADRPIDIGRLEQLFVLAEASGQQAEAEPRRDTEPEAGDARQNGDAPAPLWIAADVQLAQVRRDRLQVDDLNARAEFKDQRLDVSHVTFTMDGGSVRLAGHADVSTPDSPVFAGKVNVDNLAIAPFLAAFAPNLPVQLQGGVKTLQAEVAGKGADWNTLQRELAANLKLELDTLTVGRLGGWMGFLTRELLLRNFGIGWEDMNFIGGACNLALAAGKMNVDMLELRGNNLKLLGEGTVDLLDNNLPDLRFVPAFTGQLAHRLQKEKIPLRDMEDGFMAAPTMVLKGPVWEKTHAAKLAVDYGVEIGKIRSEVKYATDGVSAIKSLKDAVTSPGEDRKEKTQEALKGIFQTIERFDADRRDRKKPDTEDGAEAPQQQDDQAKEEPATPRDLLRGLFR